MYYKEIATPVYDAPGGSIDCFDIDIVQVLEPGDEGYEAPIIPYGPHPHPAPDVIDVDIEDIEPPF
jgi:hypothetical protein